MVAFLTKIEGNDDFADIVDFLNANSIRYSLTVAGKSVVVTESSVRSDLHLQYEGWCYWLCFPLNWKWKRSRTQGLKLFKIGTSKRRSLDKEDASKHGRNLNARLIYKEDEFNDGFDVVRDEGITHVEGDAEQVVIAAAEVVNAGLSVIVAATLVQMSETSKVNSIVFEDVEESTKEQREGKAPMVEEDVPPL
ncbi:hypothetical protein Tco_0741378 [Tanacetum coccineum]